ncbi:MAG: hypothetical protein LDLANPLL_01434 [Turneriella sp.]|nr:hypothetical protein [Turneriella sp.]
MAAVLDKPALTQKLFRLSVDKYHRMIDAGFFNGRDRVELIDGVLVQKMPKSKLHVYLTKKVAAILSKVLPAAFMVNEEKPLTLAASEPEPDIAVVEGRLEDYREGHPKTAALVVEIAFSSLSEDKEKADIYAEAKIPQYVVIDGVKKNAIIYTQIKNNRYTNIIEAKDHLTLSVADQHITLDLQELCDYSL